MSIPADGGVQLTAAALKERGVGSLRRIHKPLNPKTPVEAAGVDLLQDGDATRGKWLEKRRKCFLHGFLLNGFVFLAGLQRHKADSCWRSSL